MLSKRLSIISDWIFLYFSAWFLILLFPVWLPMFLAQKLNRFSKTWYKQKLFYDKKVMDKNE